nr:MAG TPA: hypothetical protein [Caudoviricetes sp.]
MISKNCSSWIYFTNTIYNENNYPSMLVVLIVLTMSFLFD